MLTRIFFHLNAICGVIFAIQPEFSNDGLTTECSANHGDVLLGFLTMFRAEGPDPNHRCSNEISMSLSMMMVEAFAFVISKVNQRFDILPNITLGYVTLDSCYSHSPLAALGRAQYFTGEQFTVNDTTCKDGVDHFKVVGVVGPVTSAESILVSSLLGFYQIPSVGFIASSDELSSNDRFEYYMRIAPPDRHQAEAILDFVYSFNWTYVSLVFSQESYGENGARNIEKGVKKRGMCLAVAKAIDPSAPQSEYKSVIQELQGKRNAKVLIVFMIVTVLKKLVIMMNEIGVMNEFIFVGSDGLWLLSPEFLPPGCFGIFFRDSAYPEFDEYYRTLSLSNTSAENWMKMEISRLHSCTWGVSDDKDSCKMFADQPFADQTVYDAVYMEMDAVLTLVYALDSLIKVKCPSASHNKSLLKSCITGPDLLAHALNVSFDGVSGDVEFDSFGDAKGQYDIHQYRNNGWQPVLSWLQDTDLFWKDLVQNLYFPVRGESNTLPESVCSHPCKGNEYLVPKDILCCWECRRCRSHEIPDTNGSACRSCEVNMWPDDTGSVCVAITPTYVRWGDYIAICLVTLAFLGLVACFLVNLMWVKHRQSKLIKASNREVSSIILVGVSLAFICVLVLMLKPEVDVCFIGLITFHTSVSLIYAPLLVKTNRVYRIFAAGKNGVKNPTYIRVGHQRIFIIIILLLLVRYFT